MRIVHTADWHVGRLWKSISRLDETSKVLDSLARYLEREKIDLLLVAGDVFDTSNPGADAEQLVFQFFRRLGASNIPAVVIAGNHDSPGRMDAYGTLADLAGVHMVGRPRNLANGGVIEVRTRQGEIALVAALPFAAPGLFVSAHELSEEASGGREPPDQGLTPPLASQLTSMQERFQQAGHYLARSFRPDCVNLFIAQYQSRRSGAGQFRTPGPLRRGMDGVREDAARVGTVRRPGTHPQAAATRSRQRADGILRLPLAA